MGLSIREKYSQFCKWVRSSSVLSSITVEPLMLLDGLALSNMCVYMENLQMDRICEVSFGYEKDICNSLAEYPEVSVQVQKKYSVFALYNGIISAILPLVFILFMGSWSDRYGRRIPLLAVQAGHTLLAGGYLLVAITPGLPPELLLLATFLDTLGGGQVYFLTVANSYIGDITSEASRTSRVGVANSVWFLGLPVGLMMGRSLYMYGGYIALFGTSLALSALAFLYVFFLIEESIGPFTKKPTKSNTQTPRDMRKSIANIYAIEVTNDSNAQLKAEDITKTQMLKDFFSPQRLIESIKCVLQPRQGNLRALMLLLIITCLLRRLTRSPFIFAYTRHALDWDANYYSLWLSFKNLLAALGSLIFVPVLSGRLGVSDRVLAMIGSLCAVLENSICGLTSEERIYPIWIASGATVLLNACTIAQWSMITKCVESNEVGKVSAVLGALDGVMPMVNFALYSAVYHASIQDFPSAHFFLGSIAGGLMIIIFIVIILSDKNKMYDIQTPIADVTSNKVQGISHNMRKKSSYSNNVRKLSSYLLSTNSASLSIPPPMLHGNENSLIESERPWQTIADQKMVQDAQNVVIQPELPLRKRSLLFWLRIFNIFHKENQGLIGNEKPKSADSVIVSHLIYGTTNLGSDILFPNLESQNINTEASSTDLESVER